MRVLPIVALLISAVGVARAAQPIFVPDLGRESLWDDGKAEFDVFDATENREGSVRAARVVHLIVKEPFNPDLRVKAERATATEVLKMNQIIDVPTGVYAHHQMMSTFWDRVTGALVKLSMSSNDTCGNTFKIGWLANGFLKLTFHSYWDGEGDGGLERALPENAVFSDELPWRLRTLARAESPGAIDIRLFPSAIGSKVGQPDFSPAKIVVLPPTADKIRIDVVRGGGGADRFVFDRRQPRVLRQWLRPDGSRLTLRKTQRLDYWRYNHPGDEKLLD